MAPFPLSEMIVFQQALWSAGLGERRRRMLLRPASTLMPSPPCATANESQHGAKKLADVWITLTWLDTPEDDEVRTGVCLCLAHRRETTDLSHVPTRSSLAAPTSSGR
jgi:hypothetical protein